MVSKEKLLAKFLYIYKIFNLYINKFWSLSLPNEIYKKETYLLDNVVRSIFDKIQGNMYFSLPLKIQQDKN